jgi:hypothetical protein
MKLTSWFVLPTLASAATLQVHFYSEQNCRGTKQSFTIGQLNSCHNTKNFKSYGTSNVDQSFFNRNLRLNTWNGPDCHYGIVGIGEGVGLTNQNNCHNFGQINDPGSSGWVGTSFNVR